MSWQFTSDRPVYMQIMEIIESRIVTGEYKPGEKIPSVRELAQEARVNPNTMQKAMQELEREELIYSQRTSGKFVTLDEKKISELKNKTARDIVSGFLEKMTQLGFDKKEILDIIEKN